MRVPEKKQARINSMSVAKLYAKRTSLGRPTKLQQKCAHWMRIMSKRRCPRPARDRVARSSTRSRSKQDASSCSVMGSQSSECDGTRRRHAVERRGIRVEECFPGCGSCPPPVHSSTAFDPQHPWPRLLCSVSGFRCRRIRRVGHQPAPTFTRCLEQ